jgi:hypothetical protein
LCYQCWKTLYGNGNGKGNGKGSGHTPRARVRIVGRGRAPVAKAFKELEGLLHDLEEISAGLVTESHELLERSRRFAHEIGERIRGARGMAGTIESRVREANAELRREVKLGQVLRGELRGATRALPAVSHARKEKELGA